MGTVANRSVLKKDYFLKAKIPEEILCLLYSKNNDFSFPRRCKKADLKRIAKATGAQFITSLANVEGEESFEASFLGEAAEVCQERISDDELILVKGTKARSASSIILRGPNDFYCDEMERSVHDALCVVKVPF